MEENRDWDQNKACSISVSDKVFNLIEQTTVYFMVNAIFIIYINSNYVISAKKTNGRYPSEG